MTEQVHDGAESNGNWHPAKEGSDGYSERAQDAQLRAFNTLRNLRSSAQLHHDDLMETEKASLEDLIKAKEEERSLAEVERVLADFMPEDDQTVSEWYDERIQEIEEGFNNGEIDTVAHQAFKKDLLRARILLLEQFK